MLEFFSSAVQEHKLISIIRSNTPLLNDFPRVLPALQEGGLRIVEVTLNTPQALEIIFWAGLNKSPGMIFGAGTVTTVEEAKAAIGNGAQFLICPTLDVKIIEEGLRQRIPVIPGCMTPTEIITAQRAGAELIKIFPCSSLGSGYLKDVLGPLSNSKLIAVGGVSLKNLHSYFDAGAVAVGIGNSLISPQLIKESSTEEISARVREFVSAVGVCKPRPH